MPIDIKATTQSCLFQKRKRHYSAERASKLKLRRHDVYANQSADKKEMLLAQRRSKNIESTSQGLLFEHIEVASSSETAAELPRQRILTIGESCCLDEKADKSCADDTTVCSNKGKNIIGSVSVFEYGYHNQKYCRGNKDYCCKLMGMETTNESAHLEETGRLEMNVRFGSSTISKQWRIHSSWLLVFKSDYSFLEICCSFLLFWCMILLSFN
uniref:Uncharacterized protein LOC104250114 isoform X5 n=1 Tax=Nicotiana sylvestris TaxID=4096 RepID=A0A1U7YLN2_NICSY|nr:PREDICTED: uncharacterized protein LOC104250114 isoform X5 [Nicotiana sylvestris]